MKIKGKTIAPPASQYAVIPRDDGDIVFKCDPVLDFEEFENFCPQPKPPHVQRVDGTSYQDTEDKQYLARLDNWGTNKTNWMILKSMSATDGLEWDTVDMSKPDTWDKWRIELSEVFTLREVDMIAEAAFGANMPSDERQKEALERFMSSQAEVQTVDTDHTSPTDEQELTPSGELAND